MTDQTVDKGTFPRLELAEDGHIDGRVPAEEVFGCFQRSFQGNKLEARADLPQIPENAFNGRGVAGKIIGNSVHKKTPAGYSTTGVGLDKQIAALSAPLPQDECLHPLGVISPGAGGSDSVNSITRRTFIPGDKILSSWSFGCKRTYLCRKVP
ncbi:MAG: hypothetical protein A4E74_02544 [Syntrophus sp. PtaB.Bin075]|nr:MAG: hypothetical protein A4E74_02544 [Syntrophus sp. PtaB.Bin075]